MNFFVLHMHMVTKRAVFRCFGLHFIFVRRIFNGNLMPAVDKNYDKRPFSHLIEPNEWFKWIANCKWIFRKEWWWNRIKNTLGIYEGGRTTIYWPLKESRNIQHTRLLSWTIHERGIVASWNSFFFFFEKLLVRFTRNKIKNTLHYKIIILKSIWSGRIYMCKNLFHV